MIHLPPILALLMASASWFTPVQARPAHHTPHQDQASLLRPVLMLMRPQLENRLTRVCVETASGGQADLARTLQDPCRKLAVPTSKCLIEETESSGRSLGVLREVIGGEFGEDSELVVKRCLARMFGLPADSLRDVPLKDLGRRFGARVASPTRP